MPLFRTTPQHAVELITDAKEVRRIASRHLRWAASVKDVDPTHADLIAREAATLLDLAVKVEELFENA